jgi:hypothetical protein
MSAARSRPRLIAALVAAAAFALPASAHAFCGFYVGKADAELFNKASQVVIVRDENRTVLTMSNDYEGPLDDFALVVPVPDVLRREQIHIGDRKLIERLNAYSAPRLVEYFDPDPCQVFARRYRAMDLAPMAKGAAAPTKKAEWGHSLGVTVEAEYTVGEYDIVLLSAKESQGLETYLRESGYRIPQKAADALAPYVRQNMKFFVAKVNLKEQGKTGVNYLRPIQMAFESPKFMLPIRLGMANARGPQDLVIYALTRTGRVESTNYRTVMMPTGMDIPVFVKSDFGPFYQAAFQHEHEKERSRALVTEYAWNMSWCDPCSADPLTPSELRQLGAFWKSESNDYHGAAAPAFLTRLHVRYDNEHFPEDLAFQITGDQQNFQARYVLRNAFKGGGTCDAMTQYLEQVNQRHETEAKALADLTGWDLTTIRTQMGDDAPKPKPQHKWWEQMWQ